MTQLFFPGQALQCAGDERRVFIVDVCAPNSHHYMLTAILWTSSEGTLRVTFELSPLLKGKPAEPGFNVAEQPAHLSAEHTKRLVEMGDQALPFLYEATLGVRHLDILEHGQNLLATRPALVLDLTRNAEKVERSMDAFADLKSHMLAVGSLTYQVQQLLAQQERDQLSLSDLRTAKKNVENALSKEKTRKTGPDPEAAGKICTKRACTDFAKTHKGCPTKADQGKHFRSFEAHANCLPLVAQQKNVSEIALLQARLLSQDNLHKQIADLKQELAAAVKKKDGCDLDLAVGAYNAVITNFATSAKMLITATPPAAPPAVPPPTPPAAGSASDPAAGPPKYSIEQLKELASLFKPRSVLSDAD